MLFMGGGCVGNYFKVPSTLIVPEGCEKIGHFAFEFCSRLEEVKIPKNVEEIGYRAFGECNNATIILRKLESEFKEIEDEAFYGVRYVKEEIRY